MLVMLERWERWTILLLLITVVVMVIDRQQLQTIHQKQLQGIMITHSQSIPSSSVLPLSSTHIYSTDSSDSIEGRVQTTSRNRRKLTHHRPSSTHHQRQRDGDHHIAATKESSSKLSSPSSSSSSSSSSSLSSRKCSKNELDFQQNNFELAGLHICDKDLLWQLIHLSLPDSSIFLDIGGNLGYTAARIFGLWSPGHQFNRISLFQAISNTIDNRHFANELNLTYGQSSSSSNSQTTTTRHQQQPQRTTFCRDGHFRDIPLVCIGQEQSTTLIASSSSSSSSCYTRRKIHVYSFDGQKQHVENQKRIIYHHFPHLHPTYPIEYYNDSTRAKASWTYIHAALTNKLLKKSSTTIHKGANLNNNSEEYHRVGYFKVDDNEHGLLVQDPIIRDQMIADGLKQKHPENVEFIEVPLLTVDVFTEEQGLKTVDIMKIDAEGSDLEVIEGAKHTILHKDVKVITFECTNCLIRERYESFFRMIDEEYGFDCYLHGINQIVVKMTGNCWDYDKTFIKPDCKYSRKCPYYLRKKDDDQWRRGAIDSNAYCIHRTRASILHGLVENLALYHYVDENKRGHFLKDAFLSVDEVDFYYSHNLSEWNFRKSGKKKDMIWYHRMYGRDIRTGYKYDLIIPEIG